MSSPETNGSHVDIVAVRAKLQSMAEEGRVDELIALVIDLLTRIKDENMLYRTPAAGGSDRSAGKCPEAASCRSHATSI